MHGEKYVGTPSSAIAESLKKLRQKMQNERSSYVSNVSDLRWNSRKGVLGAREFADKPTWAVEARPLRNKQAMQQLLVKGDNAIVPLTPVFPMANNGCVMSYGIPGTGKTTGILTAIRIIMGAIPRITFNEGEEVDSSGDIDMYFGDPGVVAYNEGKKELPLLSCYVTSPTANFDKKFQELGVPITAVPDLDEISAMIETNTLIFDRWWRTGRLLLDLKRIVVQVFNDGRVALPDALPRVFERFVKLFLERHDMRSPDSVVSNYNVTAIEGCFTELMNHTATAAAYVEMYSGLSRGQRARFLFLSPRDVIIGEDEEEAALPVNLTQMLVDLLEAAHAANQAAGLTIKTPFHEDYFVSIRPRSFLVVDDFAGDSYIHNPGTAFSRLLQKRRHFHASIFIALQRMVSITPFARSMATDIILYPGYGDNYLRPIWAEHFTETIPSYDLFKSIYSHCAQNGYQPLVYFKEAGVFRSGFTTDITGIVFNGRSIALGGERPEISGI